MKAKLVPVLLVLGALAVAWQNYRFFFGEEVTATLGWEEPSEEEADEELVELEPLEPITREQLDAWLASLALGSPRSPFLTHAEAFGAVAEAGEQVGLPHLAGTLWSLGRRVAWIGGRPHSEGDQVAGFEIDRIDVDAVVLHGPDGPLRLEVETGSGADGSEPDGSDGDAFEEGETDG